MTSPPQRNRSKTFKKEIILSGASIEELKEEEKGEGNRRSGEKSKSPALKRERGNKRGKGRGRAVYQRKREGGEKKDLLAFDGGGRNPSQRADAGKRGGSQKSPLPSQKRGKFFFGKKNEVWNGV